MLAVEDTETLTIDFSEKEAIFHNISKPQFREESIHEQPNRNQWLIKLSYKNSRFHFEIINILLELVSL